MAKRIIVDFDNTMGIKGCDVDDGLALLFLLGSEGAIVEAACTTFGNNSLSAVHENTLRLFGELGLSIPVYKGADTGTFDAQNPSAAAQFLARAAAEAPGELYVLATGSMTNLAHAAQIDANFFSNLAGVSLMGGITESLVITDGKIMDELNLSCSPQAALAVLGADCPVTVATAQNCLPAFFTRADFADVAGVDSWFYRTCAYWFDDMDEAYAWNGFTCWDIVAAATIVRPDLFIPERMQVTLNERLLSVGYLEQAAPHAPQARIEVPRIADARQFVAEAVGAWRRALALLGK